MISPIHLSSHFTHVHNGRGIRDVLGEVPLEVEAIQLDATIAVDLRLAIFENFENCMKKFSELVYRQHLPTFNIQTGPQYLFFPNKEFPNILFKTLAAQRLVEQFGKRIQVQCFDEELDYFDNGGLKRFASIFALIAENIPEQFEIINLGRHPNFPKSVKGALPTNILMRVLHLEPSVVREKLLAKLSLNWAIRKKPVILVKGDSGLYFETLSSLRKTFRFHQVNDHLKNVYSEADCIRPVQPDDLYDVYETSFGSLVGELSLADPFRSAFRKIFLELISRDLNRLINSAPLLHEAVGKLKTHHNSSIFLCDGLYGSLGLSIFNAMKRNKITVATTEHGLTAGLSRQRKATLNYSEPRTSDVIFGYNEAATRLFQSSKNKALVAVACGAPRETRKAFSHSLQRFLARRRLKIKGFSVFYISNNLLTNNNSFSPYYPPDFVRFNLEKVLITRVLPLINKKVVYKYYPSQNYLHETHPYLNLFPEKSEITIAGEEDFRYLREAADMLVTQGPSSTLGWCIGTCKPLVYLHSEKYEPLQDSEVLRILRECFFVFDMKGNWPSKLVDFLNNPREQIEELWQYKLKKQQIYDRQFFLNSETKPGHISAKVIRAIAKVEGAR